MKSLIVIPARMASTRLPNKPLAMIGDAPMIVQVWRRAMESGVGEVLVACDGEAIAEAVRAAGGKTVLTDPDLPSGSDRIWAALQSLVGAGAPGAAGARVQDFDVVINLQGDVPTLEPRLLKDILKPLENPEVDIATLAAEIREEAEHTNPAVVKIALAANGRALYFSRASIPAHAGPRYHHIGVYAYRFKALEKFVTLPPSPLEQREKLEQLRALEAGMRIDAVVVDTVPLGVDTFEDLERARGILG